MTSFHCSPESIDGFLRLAQQAAHQAGDILRSKPQDYTQIHLIDAGDVKLAADVASEQLIRSILEPTGLPIIGEEGGGDVNLLKQNQLYWVIDPLDGTYNYLRGLPFCCVSIALMRGIEPILGVIDDFNTHTTYSAINEGPLIVQQAQHSPEYIPSGRWLKDKQTALMLSSLRYDKKLGRMVPEHFEHLTHGFNKVRFFGTAALSLAWVAAGQAEGYIERCVCWWDVAAGLALLKAAGGHYRLHFYENDPIRLDCFASAHLDWLPHTHETFATREEK